MSCFWLRKNPTPESLPAPRCRLEYRRQKGGAASGDSGHKHQTGEKVIALVDNHGSVLSPLTIAPVNEVDMGLLPQGLKDRKRVARAAGLTLPGAVLNLEAGFDSKANRNCLFNAGLRPQQQGESTEPPKAQTGAQRFFDDALYKLRFIVERPFAWEDKFKRLLLRFETKQIHHLGFKLIAFTLINLREFCGG